ncbi:MAG TPA: glycosyltransferase family 9 protein [Candidatus Limnocylindria bacterium]|nr:glycosyltransferase family 9 protein [Candidatus Limnocylindria bacterium]
MRQILVIRGGAIGDFIVTLPVFAALRTAYPEARLEVVAHPPTAAIALATGLVDRIQALESRALAHFFSEVGELDTGWAKYFGGFDLIVTYLFDPAGHFHRNLRRSSAAQIITGPHRPSEPSDFHASLQLLRPLEALLPIDPRRLADLRFPESSSSHPTAPNIVIHPGSGSPKKNWPWERWHTLLDRLVAETDWHFTLLAGEAEGWQVDRLHSLLPVHRVSFYRNLPLPEIAVFLRSARLFLGHDSGITHLSAACGTTTLALWGPTDRTVWQPRGSRVHLLYDPSGLDQLSVSAVAEMAKTLVAENGCPSTLRIR